MKIPPVTLSEDANAYKNLAKKYIQHEKGLFILGPSGSGKTHFCKQQKENHWIDGDEIWISAGAHPDLPWWLAPWDEIRRIDKRSDIITMEAKIQGFWIIGASNYWLEPDAIVLPDWETHKTWIEHRQNNDYDGGATLDNLENVKRHRDVIAKWNADNDVPLCASVEEAVLLLTK